MQPRALFTGIRHHMPHEDYLAVQAASKSVLWAIHTQSPLHAITQRKQTNAMALGTAVHCAVLEPQHFESRYKRGPDINKNTNAYKEAKADVPLGAELMGPKEYDAALRIRDNAAAHRTLSSLMKGAEVEVSAFAAISGVQCKARPDAVADGNVLLDLKTTTDSGPRAFAASCRRYGYHVQEGWYRDIWEKAHRPSGSAGGVQDFVFIAVEKAPPYAIALYRLSEEDAAYGRLIAASAFETYRHCVQKGDWPGYRDDIQLLNLSAVSPF